MEWISERRTAHESLITVKAEFEYNAELLDEALSVHRTQIQSVNDLLTHISPTAEAVPLQEIGGLFTGILGGHTFNPRKGAVNTLVSSGNLEHIENELLRTALAGWIDQLEDATEEEAWLIDFAALQLRPRIAQYVSVRTPLATRGLLESPSEFQPNIRGLLRDRDLENDLTQYAILNDIIIEEQAAVREEMDIIIRLIEEEL